MHMVPSYTQGSRASILAVKGETQENKKPIYFYRLKTIYREMTIIQSIITVFFLLNYFLNLTFLIFHCIHFLCW